MRVSEFSPAVKNVVKLRALVDDEWVACERCGCNQPAHYHHRLPRRAGGSKDPALGRPSNCLLLCVACHGFIEVQGRASGESTRKGWLVVSGDPGPRWTAVVTHKWGEVFLTDDGGFELLPPEAE